MNVDLRIVSRQLGLLLLVLSTLILLVAGFAQADALFGGVPSTGDVRALLVATLIGVCAGAVLVLAGRSSGDVLGQREALLLVAFSWLAGAGLAALPYWSWSANRPDVETASHSFDSYTNCYFEAMSGLTTTGATILTAIGTVPRSLLLWRSLTQWMGGLGIVVLFVAVLPMLGVGGRRVYRLEAPGPSPEGVKPRIQDTARILWFIYLGLTIVEILTLALFGMDWFDAVCHTLATLATGGFSTLDAGIAGFDSTAIHIVLIVFMVLAGVNFNLYHQLIQKRWRSVLFDPELRAYLVIILVATVIVTASLLHRPADVAAAGDAARSLGSATRDAMFQVVSIQTTTGFCSADFDTWSFLAKATLLTLMFVGASAGSTGGGLKVVRVLIVAKILLAELEHIYRPKVVRSVKVGKATVDADLKLNTFVFIIGMAGLFVVGTVALMLLEAPNGVDITTAATASAATLNNIGPGLARVGATQNYAWFSAPSKILLSLLMVIGRLEMFTIVVLLSPRFWRGK